MWLLHSPWGYETINRWNPDAHDVNRVFHDASPSEEANELMSMVASLPTDSTIVAHIDLHETTDTDETEFRPAKAARDGDANSTPGEIPDGFYTVGDSLNPQPAFQTAVIDAVRQVTHIAPPDAAGQIIGTPIEQEGVINYPVRVFNSLLSSSEALR